MKKEIKLTLETTKTSEDYFDLRDEMVETLVDIEMAEPKAVIKARYKEMLFEMFRNMDDDTLQNCHEMHIEYFEERDVK